MRCCVEDRQVLLARVVVDSEPLCADKVLVVVLDLQVEHGPGAGEGTLRLKYDLSIKGSNALAIMKVASEDPTGTVQRPERMIGRRDYRLATAEVQLVDRDVGAPHGRENDAPRTIRNARGASLRDDASPSRESDLRDV